MPRTDGPTPMYQCDNCHAYFEAKPMPMMNDFSVAVRCSRCGKVAIESKRAQVEEVAEAAKLKKVLELLK